MEISTQPKIQRLESIKDLDAVSKRDLIKITYIYGAGFDNLKCPPALAVCNVNNDRFMKIITPHPQNLDSILASHIFRKKGINFIDGTLCLYERKVFTTYFEKKNSEYQELAQLIENSGGWRQGISILEWEKE